MQLTIMYNTVFYFIIYSVVGWILESIYRSICDKKLINSGFMYGPYCPIYGFGAIIMIFVLQNLKTNITLLFIGSFVLLSLWEYMVGVILEKVYNTKYWDYSNHRINIQGRVCLANSIYWGILGVIFTLIIHPFVIKMTALMPVNILKYIDISVLLIMIVDLIISSVKVNKIARNIQEIKNLGEKILSKLKDMPQAKIANQKKKLKEHELAKLQLRYNKLKITLYKQLTRMKKAFPTMQSEPINKFLSEKIDTKELKEKIKELKYKLERNKNKEE